MVSVGLVQCGQCGFGSVSDSSSCQLHFFISIGPFWCSQCHLQGFWSVALVLSEAVPFVYLASVCRSLQCLISALTQEGGGGLPFKFASSVALQGGRGAAFPVYTAQALGCSIRSVSCVACGSSFRVLHKTADSVVPAFSAFHSLSSSGSQELDGCTLPGCSAPSPLRGPSLSYRPCRSGACTLSLSATLPVDVYHPESQEVFG